MRTNDSYTSQYPGTWNDLSNGVSLGYLVEYETAPVPEPATMLLFGTGLAGIVGNRIRRKKK